MKSMTTMAAMAVFMTLCAFSSAAGVNDATLTSHRERRQMSPVGEIQALFMPKEGDSAHLEAGFLNVSNGNFTKAMSIVFPKPPTECKEPKWSVSAEGTQGQTSTMFLQNRSWFFLGQLSCEGKPFQISLLSIFVEPYPGGSDSPIPARSFASFNTTDGYIVDSIEGWNIAWDWVCNVIVLAPFKEGNQAVIRTLMVSEYDGAVRPQKNNAIEPGNGEEGWRKVSGLGGLDGGSGESTGWPYEGNCGDDCLQYTIEEYVDTKNKPLVPRRIIGRNFHTGRVVTNITDSVQATTMTYMNNGPFVDKEISFFIGIGVCCTDEWCNKECKGKEGGTILFSYIPGMEQADVLTFLNRGNPLPNDVAMGVTRLGVLLERSNQWDPTTKLFARLMIGRAIESYEIKYDTTSKAISAHFNSTSPDLPKKVQPPIMWTQNPGM